MIKRVRENDLLEKHESLKKDFSLWVIRLGIYNFFKSPEIE